MFSVTAHMFITPATAIVVIITSPFLSTDSPDCLISVLTATVFMVNAQVKLSKTSMKSGRYISWGSL